MESPLTSPALELAARQAGLAYERTIMSVDQSLMGAIRTSLSMIGFGFAMVLFFHRLSGEVGVNLHIPARNFGLSLVAMGVALVAVGLIGHQRSMKVLKLEMDELFRRRLLLRGFSRRHAPSAVIALLLLLAGLLVLLGVIVRIGPFG